MQNKKHQKRKLSRIWLGILLVVMALVLVTIAAVISWDKGAYKPQSVALEALKTTSEIIVDQGTQWTTFKPATTHAEKGLIIYPGAKVDAVAYAPLAQGIAKEGYQVVLVEMPLNFAMLGANNADKVIEVYPEIENWFIAGHSLGGVVASDYAATNEQIQGIILLASYPMDDALKTSEKQVLSLWGSEDGVLNFEQLELSKHSLPKDTRYIEIVGGNHAQFGDYGPQSGDKQASISSQEQWEQTIQSILTLMANH